jgi:hypothetical protein
MPETRSVWHRVAAKILSGERPCEDPTVAERAARELLVAVVAENKELQVRAWRSLLKIARMATGKLFDPAITTGFQRHKYSGFFLPDGSFPASESKAAELLALWLKGEISIDFRHWGRTVRNRRIDEIRKSRAKHLRPQHPFETQTQLAEHTPDLDLTEHFEMWKDRNGSIKRKPRSDKGRRRGPNSKVRSDKGKPRK